MEEVDLFRQNHLVDPQLHVWGWEIPVYLFLGGISAGVMVLSAAFALWGANGAPSADGARSADGGVDARPTSASSALRFAPLLVPVVLSLGMLALLLDLENPRNVHRFYLALRPSSPMSWGAWILLAIYPVTLLSGLAASKKATHWTVRWGQRQLRVELPRWLRRLRSWAVSQHARLQLAMLALGVMLGGYTGILLGSLGARAAWNSSLLGPLFLVSGLSTGAALLMLLPLSDQEHVRLRSWDMGALMVEVVLLGLFLLGLVTGGGAAGRRAAQLFLGGAYTAPFWVLVVATGLLVPFVLELLEGRRERSPALAAPLLILGGGLALRWILVAAGQT